MDKYTKSFVNISTLSKFRILARLSGDFPPLPSRLSDGGQ